MSDRTTGRRITMIVAALVALFFFLVLYATVFEGCQEPDSRGEVISPPDDGEDVLD